MENLKIKVNSEAESKEAQELFFELGYKLFTRGIGKREVNWIVSFADGDLCLDMYDGTNHKQITLDELRALVSLHKKPINMDMVLSEVRSDALGLLEDKEWLNTKTYEYKKAVDMGGHSQWIEIPEGAEFLTECFDNGELFRLWWKGEYKICIGYDEDWFNIHRDVGDYLEEQSGSKIVWQRAKKPEELPFVDNDPAVGLKYDIDKPRHSLLPKGSVNSVVAVLEFGAKKYDVDNWQKVDNARDRYYNAAMRHIESWWSGEKLDKETGIHHLAHAATNLFFLMWFDKDQ